MRRVALLGVFALWSGGGFAKQSESYKAAGTFAPMGKYRGMQGEAKIVRTAGQGTSISVSMKGLRSGLKYPVHVHALPCAVNEAGAHYQIDPAAEAGEANEIWLPFTADKKGKAHQELLIAHVARPDAQSIVVHDPEAHSAKMACADLLPRHKYGVYSGNFASFAKAKDMDKSISGTAQMVTGPKGTEFKLAVNGLSVSEQYISHVHLFPCSVNEAGGHYELDPSLKPGDQKNEIWFTIPVSQKSFKVNVTIPHQTRPDAQSVVIHQMVDGAMPKIACADLVRTDLDQ